MSAGGTAPTPFLVLVVCTGNICRSPAAEVLLARSLGNSGVTVCSAGLHARVGSGMGDGIAGLIGGEPAPFAARQVTPAMIQAADLVLVMTREQRSSVVGTVPVAVRRTFTLREFADLARLAHGSAGCLGGHTPADRLAVVTALAPRLRSLRVPGFGDDIDDPYGRGAQAAATAVAEIRGAVDLIAAVVAPAGMERR